MAHDLHDRLGIHTRVSEICHRAVAEVMEHEIFDLVLFAKLSQLEKETDSGSLVLILIG